MCGATRSMCRRGRTGSIERLGRRMCIYEPSLGNRLHALLHNKATPYRGASLVRGEGWQMNTL